MGQGSLEVRLHGSRSARNNVLEMELAVDILVEASTISSYKQRRRLGLGLLTLD
jgi:hypothetical protein